MSWRVVVVSSRSRLELKLGYLVVRGTEVKRILLDEISVLLIENTGCVMSVSLLEALWEHKIDVIFCDSHHLPSALLVSLYGNYESSARLTSQIAWDNEIKDLVWAEIVRDKIRKQADVLGFSGNSEAKEKLLFYASEIQPGDSSNREGHAAKVYFNSLIDHSFSRKQPSYLNEALNYGYSIVMSAVSRTIVSAGYNTQIGIFHHSVFNQFNLASDFMEPFRPLVDMKVLSLPIDEALTTESKMIIVGLLNETVVIKGVKATVLAAIEVYVRSVLEALEEKDISRVAFYEFER